MEAVDGDAGNESQIPFSNLIRNLRKAFQSRRHQEILDDENGAGDGEEGKPSDEIVYLFAYLPETAALLDSSGKPQLPPGLIPLCRLHYYRQVRSETIESVRSFIKTGVSLKLFTSGAPDRFLALLESAGLNTPTGDDGMVISGDELAGVAASELPRLAVEKTVFGGVTPEQTRQVVEALCERGETVAVYGEGPADLSFMQQADLSISAKGGSQAALGVANIVMLDRSPKVLESLLLEGQKTVNGLLDVLKLYLTQLAYLPMLIMILWLARLGFPYSSSQGGFISLATLALPSLALSLTALPGALPSVRFSHLLGWFVIPAALSICAAGVGVFVNFLEKGGSLAYAQLALTHMLIVSGLALVLLVRPPTRRNPSAELPKGATEGEEVRKGRLKALDWRVAIVVLVLLFVYLGFTTLPMAYRFFGLVHLRSIYDYLYIGGIVLLWVAAVTTFWRFFTPQQYRPWTTLKGSFSDRGHNTYWKAH
jgi:magnesium-transporting ATPase (P-type)